MYIADGEIVNKRLHVLQRVIDVSKRKKYVIV